MARLNLADPKSVAAFAEAWDGPLHLLINNAGVASPAGPHTLEGMELHFAANHLGHFALARALHRALAADGARIVVVSSSAHLFSPVVFDDIHFTFRPYDPLLANAQSRTANVLFAVGASARWADDGITANALSPGATRTCRPSQGASELAVPAWLRKTPQQAAATAVLLAVSPLLEAVGGRYFTNCNEAQPVARRPGSLSEISKSVAAYALEPANADRLWETSLRLLA